MLLYIHIPFCDSKCFYCAFNSYTTKNKLKENYINALKIQLKENILKHLKTSNKLLNTIFIGGGTPSTIDAILYKDIFDMIKPYFSKDIEITTEANPNSATFKWQKQMFDLGVNRISFGVQSFNDEKLKFLGRNHNENSAIKAIQNAKSIGFNSINCDIIYGVINDDFELIKKDFDTILTLGIEHISAYSLIIEEGTKFHLNEKSLNKTKQSLKIDDEELSYKLFDYLKSIGFEQYEIANFAKDDKFQSKHNFGYWEHKEYLGVGAGAVAYVNKKREYSQKSVEEYIKNPTYIDTEELNDEDIKSEKVLLGFRSKVGVALDIFSDKELKRIDDLVQIDKICIIENRVYNNNFLLADEISLYILD
ncbi:coproporphyrinogen III oxidase [Arcobacter sp. FW59]|nr:coproporphyrinogen III oxidase [Arcobacter sp. FW59]